MHPHIGERRAELERYFLNDLVVAYPFVRRLMASERKTGWLHQYHDPHGVILDDNRMPKACWSYAWLGRWKKSAFNHNCEFGRYQACHLLPHKVNNHKRFIAEVFESTPELDPNLLFLSLWNNLLVDKRLAGLTDNSPIVTAVLLHEVQRRYNIDLGFVGRIRSEVCGVPVRSIADGLQWGTEPADFVNSWSDFGQSRLVWIQTKLQTPRQ